MSDELADQCNRALDEIAIEIRRLDREIARRNRITELMLAAVVTVLTLLLVVTAIVDSLT